MSDFDNGRPYCAIGAGVLADTIVAKLKQGLKLPSEEILVQEVSLRRGTPQPS